MSVPKRLTLRGLELWSAHYVEGRSLEDLAAEQGVTVGNIENELRKVLYRSCARSLTDRRRAEAAVLMRIRETLRKEIEGGDLSHVERWHKLTELQYKLEGLNAPVRVEVQDLSLLPSAELRRRWKELTGVEYQSTSRHGGGQSPSVQVVGGVVPALPVGVEVRDERVLQVDQPGDQSADTDAGGHDRPPPRG